MNPICPQSAPQASPIPGVEHATWVGHDDGLQQLSVWRQRLAAGACTPPHRHDCDEVVMCLAGAGELHQADGTVRPFGPDHCVLLPRGQVHQIVNPGPAPLEIVGLFGATPVGTWLPDGQALALPWRS